MTNDQQDMSGCDLLGNERTMRESSSFLLKSE